MSLILDAALYGISFVGILTVVVFVHELGHYGVARSQGLKIEAFSIGFGPELWGFNDRYGTRWRFSLFPLGGYVKIFGDTEHDVDSFLTEQERGSGPLKAASFAHQTVWRRMAVVVGGPLANYLLAFFIFAALFAILGQRYTPPVVSALVPQSAAVDAGFQVGDIVHRLNGEKIVRFEDLMDRVRVLTGEPLIFEVERAGQHLTLLAKPNLSVVKDRLGYIHRVPVLGLKSQGVALRSCSIPTAFWLAGVEVFSLSWNSLQGIGRMLTGAQSTEGVGGVLRIAHASGKMAQEGFVSVIFFIAMLSVSLGLINLFPIPFLDGGHLFFFAIEAICGRPLSRRTQDRSFQIGLFFLGAVMFFTTINDLVHLRFFFWLTQLISS